MGIGQKKHLPFIAVTKDAADATRVRVIETGMDDFVSRPVDAGLLFEKIHQQVSVWGWRDK